MAALPFPLDPIEPDDEAVACERCGSTQTLISERAVSGVTRYGRAVTCQTTITCEDCGYVEVV
jgi:hypothetical protein